MRIPPALPTDSRSECLSLRHDAHDDLHSWLGLRTLSCLQDKYLTVLRFAVPTLQDYTY